jgi:hypothetical protein
MPYALETMINIKTTYLLALLLGFGSLIVEGQSTKLILTKKQNTSWLDSLSSFTLPYQIESIKQRLFSDTLIYNVNEHSSDKIILNNLIRSEQRKSYNNFAEGRLRFVLVDKNKKNRSNWILGFTCHNWTDNRDVRKFCEFLSADKVLEINTMDSAEVKNVFSSSTAKFGAIGITFKRRKYIKELIELDLNKK